MASAPPAPAPAPTADARLYALVDLAAAPTLVPMIEHLARSGAARCLFEGRLPDALRRASPHIVDCARAPDLMARWRSEGAGQPWGVLMETPMPMHEARRHVRRFLQVKLPDGSGPVLCRFWDPRVLPVLIEHADEEWRARLFRGTVSYHRAPSDPVGFSTWPASRRRSMGAAHLGTASC